MWIGGHILEQQGNVTGQPQEKTGASVEVNPITALSRSLFMEGASAGDSGRSVTSGPFGLLH